MRQVLLPFTLLGPGCAQVAEPSAARAVRADDAQVVPEGREVAVGSLSMDESAHGPSCPSDRDCGLGEYLMPGAHS